MTSDELLIQEALAAEDADESERAERAVHDLLAAGPQALRCVLSAAVERADRHHPSLYEVVRRSTGPEAVPVLLAHTGAGPHALEAAVLYALARSDGDEGPDQVEAILADRTALYTTRAAAAEALQGAARPAAGEVLREVLAEQHREPENPEWPLLLVATAVALATTGDHSGAAALRSLLASPHELARAMAVGAYRLVLDEDSLRLLARALADPGIEVRREAVDPVFLIGSPAAADLLLRSAREDLDDQVRYNALIRFGDIAGLALGGDPENLPFADERWRELRDTLDPAVCHRFGVPITLADLVEEFTDEELLRTSVAEELRLLTGVDVPTAYARHGLDAALRSVRDVPFTTGRIHKWGHLRPMPSPVAGHIPLPRA
ncbi:HEAT repeat domain-containing protein [Streptomyces sp. NPDC051018]|uniref:HEAT repeat domain-containing protein n=1 Tax=Streptomyces sp. NPDC051018 TaxID=3365639 RepID=UPI0037BBBEB0